MYKVPHVLLTLVGIVISMPKVAAEEKLPQWVGTDSLVVAYVKGSNRFAAYSKLSGNWTTHSFSDDVKPIPIVSRNLVAFRLDGKSVKELVAVDERGEWQVHKLPAPISTPCIPVVDGAVATYRVGDRTYAFSSGTGTWDSIEVQGDASLSDEMAMVVSTSHIYVFSAQTGVWAKSPVLSTDE